MKDSNILKLILSIALVFAGSLLGIVYNNMNSRVLSTESKTDSLQEQFSKLDKITSEAIVRIDGRLDGMEIKLGIPVTKPSAYIESMKKQLAVPTQEVK